MARHNSNCNTRYNKQFIVTIWLVKCLLASTPFSEYDRENIPGGSETDARPGWRERDGVRHARLRRRSGNHKWVGSILRPSLEPQWLLNLEAFIGGNTVFEYGTLFQVFFFICYHMSYHCVLADWHLFVHEMFVYNEFSYLYIMVNIINRCSTWIGMGYLVNSLKKYSI